MYRIITGYLKVTPVEYLHELTGIAPPSTIRRKLVRMTDREKLEDSTHSICGQFPKFNTGISKLFQTHTHFHLHIRSRYSFRKTSCRCWYVSLYWKIINTVCVRKMAMQGQYDDIRLPRWARLPGQPKISTVGLAGPEKQL